MTFFARRDGRRPGSVYGYPTWHAGPAPDGLTGVRAVVGYVGQSRQKLAARDRQHRGLAPNRDGTTRPQPWSDLIADGGIYLIEAGLWTDAELDEREQFHMDRLLPLYNIRGNLDNPYQIPQWTAREERDARDVARGLPPIDWESEPAEREQELAAASVRPPARPVAVRPLPVQPPPPPVDVPPPPVPDPPGWSWPLVWAFLAMAVWWAAGPLDLAVPWRAFWGVLVASLPVTSVWWLSVGSRRH